MTAIKSSCAGFSYLKFIVDPLIPVIGHQLE